MSLSHALSLMRQGNLLFNYYTQTTSVEEAALKLWPVKLLIILSTVVQLDVIQSMEKVHCQKNGQKLSLGW